MLQLSIDTLHLRRQLLHTRYAAVVQDQRVWFTGTAWCVVSGFQVAWRAHWPLNRMGQDQRVRAFLFAAWVSRRGCVALFQGFPVVRNALDLGVGMPFLPIVSLWEMNARDAW